MGMAVFVGAGVGVTAGAQAPRTMTTTIDNEKIIQSLDFGWILIYFSLVDMSQMVLDDSLAEAWVNLGKMEPVLLPFL